MFGPVYAEQFWCTQLESFNTSRFTETPNVLGLTLLGVPGDEEKKESGKGQGRARQG